MLSHVADVTIHVGSPVTIGETPYGQRRVVPILGGDFSGPRINATILAGGADYQVIRGDGYTTLEARYVARLDNDALLYIDNVGVRFGPPDVMARISRGEWVDPAQVYFRTTPRFETASAAHQWLLQPLFLATGARYPDRVELQIYQVG